MPIVFSGPDLGAAEAHGNIISPNGMKEGIPPFAVGDIVSTNGMKEGIPPTAVGDFVSPNGMTEGIV